MVEFTDQILKSRNWSGLAVFLPDVLNKIKASSSKGIQLNQISLFNRIKYSN